jgi:NAD+ kinase
VSRPRVLVVFKKSAYQIYVHERGHARVAELLDSGDPAVSTLLRAHEDHEATVEETRRVLREAKVTAVFRRRSDPRSQQQFDLVLTVGGDGTLLSASHMVARGCPVLAINSAPRDSVGYFCAGTRTELAALLDDALSGRLSETRLTRMRVLVDDEIISSRVLNDVLFSHSCPAATTRYAIRLRGHEEVHKSSGVWVGTPAGSTAALRSAGGRVQPITSKRLQFVVREPYAAAARHEELLKGFIAPDEHLDIQSHIRSGHLYIDGPHMKREIEIGSTLRMERSDQSLSLLGFRGRRVAARTLAKG